MELPSLTNLRLRNNFHYLVFNKIDKIGILFLINKEWDNLKSLNLSIYWTD